MSEIKLKDLLLKFINTDNNFLFSYKNFWQKQQLPIGTAEFINEKIGKSNFNQNGYRDLNYKKIKNKYNGKFFCFGDSSTVNLNIPDEHTWPFILGKKINIEPINYGVNECSADFISRQIYQIITSIAPEDYPRHIFILWPDIFKKEHILYNKNLDIDCQQVSFLPSNIEVNIKNINVLDPFFNFVKNFKFVELLLANKEISWSWISNSNILNDLPITIVKDYLNLDTHLNNEALITYKNINNQEIADVFESLYLNNKEVKAVASFIPTPFEVELRKLIKLYKN
jgi:hypothetical protein